MRQASRCARLIGTPSLRPAARCCARTLSSSSAVRFTAIAALPEAVRAVERETGVGEGPPRASARDATRDACYSSAASAVYKRRPHQYATGSRSLSPGVSFVAPRLLPFFLLVEENLPAALKRPRAVRA